MCIACETPANLEAQDAFSGRLVKLYNDAMIVLLLSMGHRTGLFDVMADGEPRTSRQLAHDAGLNERYVREWLALSCGMPPRTPTACRPSTPSGCTANHPWQTWR